MIRSRQKVKVKLRRPASSAAGVGPQPRAPLACSGPRPKLSLASLWSRRAMTDTACTACSPKRVRGNFVSDTACVSSKQSVASCPGIYDARYIQKAQQLASADSACVLPSRASGLIAT